jgi:hypothetical protein
VVTVTMNWRLSSDMFQAGVRVGTSRMNEARMWQALKARYAADIQGWER